MDTNDGQMFLILSEFATNLVISHCLMYMFNSNVNSFALPKIVEQQTKIRNCCSVERLMVLGLAFMFNRQELLGTNFLLSAKLNMQYYVNIQHKTCGGRMVIRRPTLCA